MPKDSSPGINSRLARVAAQRPKEVEEAAAQVATAVASPPAAPTLTAPEAPTAPAAEGSAPGDSTGAVQLAIQLPDLAGKRDRTRPVNLTWHEGFIKRFDRYCKKVGVSRSSLSEMLLTALLEQLEAKAK